MRSRNIAERAVAAALRGLRRLRAWPDTAKKRRLCVVMPGAVLHPESRILNMQPRERIEIGPRSQLLCQLHTFGHGGRIRIGADCFIGENTRIWSSDAITIGDRVLISHDVNIHDNNAHSDSAAARAEHFRSIFSTGHPPVLEGVASRPVTIGNDVWIGFGATVFKGVTIGDGAIVGARSIVTRDVAPYTKVVGSPARAIGESLP